VGGLAKSRGAITRIWPLPKEDEKIRFRDIQAQPRKIISSPTWSGIESEHVCYNAGYTNVHEFIPWRTLTGRQQLYQDHPWMIDFGEALVSYRPPINTARCSICWISTARNRRRSCSTSSRRTRNGVFTPPIRTICTC
jgi:nitrate reductase alpha subunit